jgi:hypothetical protein
MTDEFFDCIPKNITILDSFVKMESVINKYSNILCSISGGGVVIVI